MSRVLQEKTAAKRASKGVRAKRQVKPLAYSGKGGTALSSGAAHTPAPRLRPEPGRLSAVRGRRPTTGLGRVRVSADAQAIMDRARRVQECQAEVFAAIAPILARHGCRLATVQEIVDGQPGPLRILVVAQD